MKLNTAQITSVVKKAATALYRYCKAHDLHVTVTGVSGGLDSAVTLALSREAVKLAKRNGYELKSIGLILPCHSDPEHTRMGKKVIKTFKAEMIEIDLSSVFDVVEKQLMKVLKNIFQDLHYRTVHGNIKARLRMALGTYFIANLMKGIVLSTDNYSEYWMGFWTLHGDVGDFGMIQELWKGDELPALAKYLGVPQEVIDAAPTDGLGISEGGDEAQIGASYQVVDDIVRRLQKSGIDLNGSPKQLKKLPNLKPYSRELVIKIAKRVLFNAFKRKNPLILKRDMLGLC